MFESSRGKVPLERKQFEKEKRQQQQEAASFALTSFAIIVLVAAYNPNAHASNTPNQLINENNLSEIKDNPDPNFAKFPQEAGERSLMFSNPIERYRGPVEKVRENEDSYQLLRISKEEADALLSIKPNTDLNSLEPELKKKLSRLLPYLLSGEIDPKNIQIVSIHSEDTPNDSNKNSQQKTLIIASRVTGSASGSRHQIDLVKQTDSDSRHNRTCTLTYSATHVFYGKGANQENLSSEPRRMNLVYENGFLKVQEVIDEKNYIFVKVEGSDFTLAINKNETLNCIEALENILKQGIYFKDKQDFVEKYGGKTLTVVTARNTQEQH